MASDGVLMCLKNFGFQSLEREAGFLKHLHINADSPYIANDTGAIIHNAGSSLSA